MIADAVGFVEGPGGRSARFEESVGRWRVFTQGLPICPVPGGLGGVEGCSLDLDPTTGELLGEASVNWTISCPQ